MTVPDRTPVLLIVDDEEMVLTSLRSFLMLETEYEVLTFSSAAEALEAVNGRTIDLVVSDYLMPGMTGIDFLLEVKKWLFRVFSGCPADRCAVMQFLWTGIDHCAL